jgi:hypothetical protein
MALFSALMVMGSAHAQLPPEVQADMMAGELVQAVEAKDYKKVISVVSKMREITPDLPHDVFFYEAEARVRVGSLELGRKALDQYLTVAGRNGTHYQKALELYADMKVRALEMARIFLESVNKTEVEMQQWSLKDRFALFDNPRLKRSDVDEVFTIGFHRKRVLFSELEPNPCNPVVDDYLYVSASVRPKGTNDLKDIVTKEDALVWSNKTKIDLRHITGVRPLDMFNSKNDIKNFIILDYELDSLPYRYKINDKRFVGFSKGQWETVDAKGILMLIPNVDSHKHFIPNMKRVIEFCKIAQGDV